MTQRRRRRLAHVLVRVAGAAGVLHAGASSYWALGGQWLLATVGRWAVDLSAEAPRAYGGVNTTVSAAVLAGLIRADDGYDSEAMKGTPTRGIRCSSPGVRHWSSPSGSHVPRTTATQ